MAVNYNPTLERSSQKNAMFNSVADVQPSITLVTEPAISNYKLI